MRAIRPGDRAPFLEYLPLLSVGRVGLDFDTVASMHLNMAGRERPVNILESLTNLRSAAYPRNACDLAELAQASAGAAPVATLSFGNLSDHELNFVTLRPPRPGSTLELALVAPYIAAEPAERPLENEREEDEFYHNGGSMLLDYVTTVSNSWDADSLSGRLSVGGKTAVTVRTEPLYAGEPAEAAPPRLPAPRLRRAARLAARPLSDSRVAPPLSEARAAPRLPETRRLSADSAAEPVAEGGSVCEALNSPELVRDMKNVVLAPEQCHQEGEHACELCELLRSAGGLNAVDVDWLQQPDETAFKAMVDAGQFNVLCALHAHRELYAVYARRCAREAAGQAHRADGDDTYAAVNRLLFALGEFLEQRVYGCEPLFAGTTERSAKKPHGGMVNRFISYVFPRK